MGAKKILVVAAVVAVLAGCDAEKNGGPGQDEKEKSDVVKHSKVYKTFNDAPCGSFVNGAGGVLLINSSSSDMSFRGAYSLVKIEGSTNDVCIDGDIEKVVINSSSNDVYVSGKVGSVVIEGSNNDVCVFGGMTGVVNINGSSNDVYTDSMAAFNTGGSNNDIEAAAECK